MTYTMVYEGTLISVPDSPAAKCDFCHDVVYDTSTLQRIDILMRQAGSPQKRQNSRGKLLVDSERRIYGANGKS